MKKELDIECPCSRRTESKRKAEKDMFLCQRKHYYVPPFFLMVAHNNVYYDGSNTPEDKRVGSLRKYPDHPNGKAEYRREYWSIIDTCCHSSSNNF